MVVCNKNKWTSEPVHESDNRRKNRKKRRKRQEMVDGQVNMADESEYPQASNSQREWVSQAELRSVKAASKGEIWHQRNESTTHQRRPSTGMATGAGECKS